MIGLLTPIYLLLDFSSIHNSIIYFTVYLRLRVSTNMHCYFINFFSLHLRSFQTPCYLMFTVSMILNKHFDIVLQCTQQ